MLNKLILSTILNILALIFTNFNEIRTNSLNISKDNKMPLAFTKIFNITNECTEIQIPNNYKKLILKLESNSLNKILVTDMKIDSCNEKTNIKACCNKNATFCMENTNPTNNEFHLNYCIDYTYIYACKFKDDPKNIIKDLNNTNTSQLNNTIIFPEKIANITVNADIVKGQGCTTAEYIAETECSTLGLINCLDQTKCFASCVYVECRQESASPKSKIFSMCLPSELRDSEIVSRCKNHVAFKDIIPEPFKVNCTNPNEFDYDKKNSSHTFFKFLIVIFGVFVLILFISSVYYRSHIGNYKTAPFEPPSICPNFIYPRQTYY